MTTKRYRLKPEVAEHEFEISDSLLGFKVLGFNFGDHTVTASRELFEEIAPPTPPEPEPGAYQIGDVLCVKFPVDNQLGFDGWNLDGQREIGDWSGVWAKLGGPDVQIVRLVPERPALAVELPWRHVGPDGTTTEVDADGDIAISTRNGNVLVASPPLREMAAALAAADQAEAVQT